ncbi:RDD family protein [Kribbella sp. NPDC051770]|uniref:RDD family protein n=1 Tax=Kribbella sp. NPDC051770 TaxID=3155413 RepID=UPI0034409385
MTALTPASTRVVPRRCLQWGIDVLLVFVLSVLIAALTLWSATKLGGHGPWLLRLAAFTFVGSIGLLQIGNDILLPLHNGGRTVGMLVTGLRTVTLEGTLPSWKQFGVRYLLWTVDGLFWGIVGFVVMLCTPYRQRLGDLLARTVVVRFWSADQPVLPGPDSELGAVAEPELPLGVGQVRLDRGQ